VLIALPAVPVLELRGVDAPAFAQAQFASDVATLAPGHWQWSAWLTAQGRVRAAFAVLRASEQQFLLLLRGGDGARLREDLRRFVFRSRVTLDVRTDLAAYGTSDASDLAAFGGVPEGDALTEHGARLALALPEARWLVLAPGTDLAVTDPALLAAWQLADIRAGLAHLPPDSGDTLLPQWLGLVRLGAISVRKGCYPGQEVMARLHFKGGNKRGLAHVAFDTDTLPAPGTAFAGGADAGLLLDSVFVSPGRAEGLAVLPLAAAEGQRLADTAGTAIQVVSRFA
jgi:folate-binding protein YgfZ